MVLLSPALQAFLEVAEVGTEHGAAERLRLTLAAVTTRLKNLETELASSLFLRSRRGMALTTAGEHLLRTCREIRNTEGELRARLCGEKTAPCVRVRIFGTSSIMRARVIPALAGISATHPELLYQFMIEDTASGMEALSQGKCDFAIVAQMLVPNECDSKQLRKERYLLCVPAAWAKRSVEDVVGHERMIDFDEADDFTFNWLIAAKLSHAARTDRLFANNTDAMCSLTQLEAGYSVLSEEYALPLVRKKTIAVLAPRQVLEVKRALVWYPRTHMPSSLKAVVKALT